jgi:hypothetical protein
MVPFVVSLSNHAQDFFSGLLACSSPLNARRHPPGLATDKIDRHDPKPDDHPSRMGTIEQPDYALRTNREVRLAARGPFDTLSPCVED